ncbi:hypothetical protein V5E97_08660 [Singulisphaera sp. Ch08]|uniref:Uncharacterized protein n=1 Tax=Singulisphaera sp. Ch08 TaxID=3120278 RepID=A0AAU7CLX9_9BACT
MSIGQAKPRGLCDARFRALSRRRRGAATALRFETLETRRVLSTIGDPVVGDPTLDSPNETYDQALSLGDVWAVPAINRHGSLGAGESGAGDVEWYRFELDRPARVTLRVESSQPDSSFRGVLSLFRSDFGIADFTNLQGLRRLDLAIADHADGVAAIDRVIGPGTYGLAVSGAGNEIFSPVVAHSGFPGSIGDFDLSLSALEAGIEPADGPWVLSSDPAPDALLVSSPLVIRVELSHPLDPSTIEAGQSVRLIYSLDGTFSAGGGQTVPLAALDFSGSAGELLLVPASPLAPGSYRVVLAGTGDLESSVLAGIDGTPLGTDALNPAGRDHVYTFRVGGIEGSTNLAAPANDTAAGAYDLGDLTSLEPVRIEGSIGDDPFYNPANALDPLDPLGRFNPGNDVDLYHFRVNGPGTTAFVADVFGGRIGSSLSPSLSLFRLDAETQHLENVDFPMFLYNLVPFADRLLLPQLFDATMAGNLEAGDYYIAVTSRMTWSYDPSVSHSNEDGYEVGPYVLNLFVSPTAADAPPLSRNQPAPPSEAFPTDSVDDFESTPGAPVILGPPPTGHAPGLPGRPGMGGGVQIYTPTVPGTNSLPVPGLPNRPGLGGGIRIVTPTIPAANSGPSLESSVPQVEEASSFTPPFQNEQPAGISSSIDLSVLAFQPVGGVTRTEQEPATQPRPTVSGAVGVTSGVPLASQSLVYGAPILVGVAPSPLLEMGIANASFSLEPTNATVISPAGLKGIVPQSVVPWAPDPDQFDARPAVVGGETGGRPHEFNVAMVVSQPPELERGVVPKVTEEAKAFASPTPFPSLALALTPTASADDGFGDIPEETGPAVTASVSLSEPEDQDESHVSLKVGWALLAISSLTSLMYFRQWEWLRPWCLNRSSLGGETGKRPAL